MTARPAAATRELLVAAGMDTLRELTAAQLVTAVGTRGIAQRAGVSVATLFHHFGSVEGYAEALIARVFDPGVSPTGEIAGKIGAIEEGGGPLPDAVTYHRSEFDRVLADREHRLRVGLWAFGGGSAHQAYGDYVRASDARVVTAARGLYDVWGREVCAPFDLQGFVAAQAALLSGAVIRHTIDPAAVDAGRFARLAASISLVLLRERDERVDVDERLAPINRFRALPRRRAGVREEPTGPSTRDRVLEVAVQIFTRSGYGSTTVADVAGAAYVSPSTVYGLFGSRAGLAIAALQHEASTACRPADAPADLHAALVELAEFLLGRREQVAVYLARVTAGEALAEPDSVLAALTRVLVAARKRGELHAGLDVEDLAPSLLLVLAARVTARPAEDAAAAVRHLERVCLGGLAPSGG